MSIGYRTERGTEFGANPVNTDPVTRYQLPIQIPNQISDYVLFLKLSAERTSQSGTEIFPDVFHNRIPNQILNRVPNRLPIRGNRVSANRNHRSLARPDVLEIRDFEPQPLPVAFPPPFHRGMRQTYTQGKSAHIYTAGWGGEERPRGAWGITLFARLTIYSGMCKQTGEEEGRQDLAT